MNKNLFLLVLASSAVLSLVEAAPKPKPKPDLSENPVPASAAVAAVDSEAAVNVQQQPQPALASGVALNPVESADVDLTSVAKQKRQEPPADGGAGGGADAGAGGGGGDAGHQAADEKERKGTKSTAGLVRKSAQHNVVAWPTGLGYVRGSRPLNRFMQG